MRPSRDIPAGAIQIDLPSARQHADHTCGAACLVAIAAHHGIAADEAALTAQMGFSTDGSDPVHVLAGVRALGLAAQEVRGMTLDELRACLAAGRPVMLTLQAWGEGHWVVAIGHDAHGIYVEDPYLPEGRGVLSYDELAACWHDVEGPDRRPLVRYGIAVWRSLRSPGRPMP